MRHGRCHVTRKAVPEDSYGGRLTAAMRAAGLTVAQLAEVVGVDPATVSQWRTNAFQPDEKRNEVIAAAVNRSPAWLRYGVEGEASPLRTGGEAALGIATLPFPRHVEGMLKRFEAEVEEAPISDATRAALLGVLRAPDQAARYRDRFETGAESADTQRARLAGHLALLRALLNGLVADALPVGAPSYPLADDVNTLVRPTGLDGSASSSRAG